MKSSCVKALMVAGLLCAFGTPAFAAGTDDAYDNDAASPSTNTNGAATTLPPGNLPSSVEDGNGADADGSSTAPETSNGSAGSGNRSESDATRNSDNANATPGASGS